jgi:hypothetical protein
MHPTTIKFTEGFVYMFIRPLLQQNQSKTLHHTLHANRTHTDECQQVLFKPSQLKGNMHPCIVFLSILHSQASPSWHLLLLRMRVYEGDTCRFFRASQANVTRAVTSHFLTKDGARVRSTSLSHILRIASWVIISFSYLHAST